MIRSFMTEARESWQSFFSYAQQTKTLRWFIGLSIVFLYGIRLTQGDIFVDSDIMLTDPQNLIFSWYGHQRFGLVFTKPLPPCFCVFWHPTAAEDGFTTEEVCCGLF